MNTKLKFVLLVFVFMIVKKCFGKNRSKFFPQLYCHEMKSGLQIEPAVSVMQLLKHITLIYCLLLQLKWI